MKDKDLEQLGRELADQYERVQAQYVSSALGGSLPKIDPVEMERLRQLAGQVQFRIIENKAAKWGIELPNKPEWYDSALIKLDPDGTSEEMCRWLNQSGITMVSRQIKEARFAYWKQWVDLLVPILALLVAALALLKEIIVEVLKGV